MFKYCFVLNSTPSERASLFSRNLICASKLSESSIVTPRYFTVLQSVIWEKSKDNVYFSGSSLLGGIIKFDFERLRVNLFEIIHLLILLISKDIFARRLFKSWSANNMQISSAKSLGGVEVQLFRSLI